MPMTLSELKLRSFELRKSILKMCIKSGTGHVSSSMSCIEILVALYYGGIMKFDPANPAWDKRDRLILSKAQASPALYCILADLGYFDKKKLATFAQAGGAFGVHLQGNVPGAEISCGSLGQGFGTAAGIALAAGLNRDSFLTFALLGDGELYEGAVWETAMFAAHNDLNNLVAIIDRNYLCVTDFTENLVALEPLEDKWRSFGWDTARVDGHSMEEVLRALATVRSRRSRKPLVIIADTVKGKGIDSYSDTIHCHGIAPAGKDAEIALAELERSYLP